MIEITNSAIPRTESSRMLTGRGRFIHTVILPRMLQVAFMRSPVAHGRFSRIDTSGVSSMPGVEAVLTAKEIGALIVEAPVTKLDTIPHHISPVQLPLADGLVRFQGEPVAMVVAQTVDQAEDAVSALSVNYDQLPISLDNTPASKVEIGVDFLNSSEQVSLEASFFLCSASRCDARAPWHCCIVRSVRGPPRIMDISSITSVGANAFREIAWYAGKSDPCSHNRCWRGFWRKTARLCG